MAPSTPKFKVAAAHAAPVFMDKKATIKKVIRLIEQAAQDEIKLVVFPETFVPGYPYWIECYPPLKQVGALAKYAEESVVVENNNEDVGAIQDACRRSSVAINLGISERMAGGHTLFNSQVIIDSDGSILGVHRKLQPTYVERLVWAQGNGSSLRNWPLSLGYNLGGLACWEHTMNGARQALISQNQHIHAGAWPALSTMAGFEAVADAQIEALMKTHALTAQVFVITASNYVDDTCLDWMKENLGEQDLVKAGGGWSSVLHPFCAFIAGPHTGAEEKLVQGEVDMSELGAVKVWIDAAGHYQRPEILQFNFDSRPLWADEKKRTFKPRWEDKNGSEDVEADLN
ncbi:carbon-nitrogen hydrolase [Aaosphaeria arxii CBS 175.79]|uniref:Carbon-nitrogen hydrolase n=1 Tax=Aaosphaeria arxii CBS 175.79 TaxID=1450172 RepID=A0A6A5XUF6_9PLEO|nr:carbon-nitrogen hydrolase [Aaosphaeria arxii CBS 175.79]KAF2016341.1 carbon-nitrogen hydrolase [Aaosphaeria arxii CBS 175.79]